MEGKKKKFLSLVICGLVILIGVFFIFFFRGILLLQNSGDQEITYIADKKKENHAPWKFRGPSSRFSGGGGFVYLQCRSTWKDAFFVFDGHVETAVIVKAQELSLSIGGRLGFS